MEIYTFCLEFTSISSFGLIVGLPSQRNGEKIAVYQAVYYLISKVNINFK